MYIGPQALCNPDAPITDWVNNAGWTDPLTNADVNAVSVQMFYNALRLLITPPSL